MNRVVRFFVMIAILSATTHAIGQKKIDEERMQRDIEVTENILSTLIKQQLDKRSFFPMEIEGDFREGFGVIYKLPYSLTASQALGFTAPTGVTVLDGRTYNYTFSFDKEMQEELGRVDEEMKRAEDEMKHAQDEMIRSQKEMKRYHYEDNDSNDKTVRTTVISPRKPEIQRINPDSLREINTNRLITACKDFLADYGDLLTQLQPSDKIVITNRGEGDRIWYGAFFGNSRPSLVSVETNKSDITEFKQGKITRDSFMKRIKVVNSVLDDELQPDLELITSIFNRLYKPDLSKTFFTEENLYYERMKDYGVIYYMQVYSSNANSGFSRREDFLYSMPTIGLENLTQEERDKKVIEIYPKFERDLKEDMLEYGRTIKSLKPEEQLVFNIKLTKCENCGIPSTLELAIKSEVLNQFSAGKITKDAALTKFTVKKGPVQ